MGGYNLWDTWIYKLYYLNLFGFDPFSMLINLILIELVGSQGLPVSRLV